MGREGATNPALLRGRDTNRLLLFGRLNAKRTSRFEQCDKVHVENGAMPGLQTHKPLAKVRRLLRTPP